MQRQKHFLVVKLWIELCKFSRLELKLLTKIFNSVPDFIGIRVEDDYSQGRIWKWMICCREKGLPIEPFDVTADCLPYICRWSMSHNLAIWSNFLHLDLNSRQRRKDFFPFVVQLLQIVQVLSTSQLLVKRNRKCRNAATAGWQHDNNKCDEPNHLWFYANGAASIAAIRLFMLPGFLHHELNCKQPQRLVDVYYQQMHDR